MNRALWPPKFNRYSKNAKQLLSNSLYLYRVRQCGPTTGPRVVCGPPQRFQLPAGAFRKNLNVKFVKGYICLTDLLVLDRVHLHKNNEYYFFCIPFCFIYLIYDQIRRYCPPLTLRWGTCIDNLFSRCPDVRCVEEYIWHDELSTNK